MISEMFLQHMHWLPHAARRGTCTDKALTQPVLEHYMYGPMHMGATAQCVSVAEGTRWGESKRGLPYLACLMGAIHGEPWTGRRFWFCSLRKWCGTGARKGNKMREESKEEQAQSMVNHIQVYNTSPSSGGRREYVASWPPHYRSPQFEGTWLPKGGGAEPFWSLISPMI